MPVGVTMRASSITVLSFRVPDRVHVAARVRQARDVHGVAGLDDVDDLLGVAVDQRHFAGVAQRHRAPRHVAHRDGERPLRADLLRVVDVPEDRRPGSS